MAPMAQDAMTRTLTTPRGATLPLRAEFPSGAGPFPALILAPGQRYPMDRPILERVASAVLACGVAVVRFDWAYLAAPAGQPSQGLVLEQEDMLAVLDWARRDAGLAGDRLFVGGKSMGSVVAWRLFAAQPRLLGALLLTPLCTRPAGAGEAALAVGSENYPGLGLEARPLFLLAGDRDPQCAAADLYRFAAQAAGPARVAVLGGDHGLIDGAGSEAGHDRSEARNAELAGTLAADFIATLLRRGQAWRPAPAPRQVTIRR
jgi:predicted alpha/beta-hydrolase family hydrolase